MVVPDKPAALTPEASFPALSRLPAEGARGIEELLRERLQLDELLQQQFRRDITLLFTDIQGSTAYFERHGDLGGRQMVQRYHDVLFPLITHHQGSIVKTVGDAIMASFTEPTPAVQGAMVMQRALRDHNQGREVAEQVHIRIGINSGPSLVEARDVFGDVVNVAARVEACALPDQILISKATYERLPPSVPCRFLGATEVKGKATPIELYEVSWDERKTFQETVLLRGPGVLARPTRICALEVARQGDRLKLSVHERWPGEERPVRHYEYLEVSWAGIQQHVDAMVALLLRMTDRCGTLEPAVWQEIKAHGEALYCQLLTAAIREKLQSSTATDLFVSIDDALVQIPWELLFDGQHFLCRRFSMGRLVSTQQVLVERQEHRPGQTLKMLIVADPQGDLPAAAGEGQTIHTELAGDAGRLRVDLRHHPVGTASMQAALARYNVLHYAGHADYDLQDPSQSGWRLADGKLTARDVLQLGEAAAVPALIFCNACQSGQTQAWTLSPAAEQGLYGLANAFLLAGAQHYIGSFWELPDQPGATCAVAFYRALAQGASVGEALRHARQTLAERYGEASAVWASYVLYGDPTRRYLQASVDEPLVDPALAAGETVTRGESRPRVRRKAFWYLGAGALLTLLFLVVLLTPRWWTGTARRPSLLSLAYQALAQGEPDRARTLFQQQVEAPEPRARSQAYAGLAAVALARGDYQGALESAAQAERTDPDIGYSHVIRGHVLVHQGKTAEALAAYRTATVKPHALPWQQAMAYDRLGRLYAAQGETAKALEHYDKAITQHRDLAVVHPNKAYLLEQLGKRQEALELYRQALHIDPQDALTAMLLREAERREQLAQDREQQEHIDRLVDELVQAYRAGDRPESLDDGWTSKPLTLAFLEVRHQGNAAARAGEAEFFALSMAQALRASRRVIIVEREVLHKVLAELKLNASEVADAQAGLGRGRVLVARLLATGSITRYGEAGMVSLRLIETATTRVSASVAQLLAAPDELSRLVEQVAGSLLHELRHAYPLQGHVVRTTPEGSVIPDIGAQQGVTPGLVLQVFDHDAAPAGTGQVGITPGGRLEVTRVDTLAAQARVLEHTGPLVPGSKVREVVPE